MYILSNASPNRHFVCKPPFSPFQRRQQRLQRERPPGAALRLPERRRPVRGSAEAGVEERRRQEEAQARRLQRPGRLPGAGERREGEAPDGRGQGARGYRGRGGDGPGPRGQSDDRRSEGDRDQVGGVLGFAAVAR